MSTAALAQTLFSLPIEERIELADQLYASVPSDWQAGIDQAWLEEAERRDAEMDADPSIAMSKEELIASISAAFP